MSLNDAGTAPAGPSYLFWMIPWMISAVPSVAMNAFTRSFVMIRPFTRPTAEADRDHEHDRLR